MLQPDPDQGRSSYISLPRDGEVPGLEESICKVQEAPPIHQRHGTRRSKCHGGPQRLGWQQISHPHFVGPNLADSDLEKGG